MKPKKLPKKAVKAREKKPIASKPAKKREANSRKQPPQKPKALKFNKAGFLKDQKPTKKTEAKLSIANVEISNIAEDLRFLSRNFVRLEMGFARKMVAESMPKPPPRKRDLLGEDNAASFDAAMFGDCVELLRYASREEVFYPRDYAAALTQCQKAGFDIDAMIQTVAVEGWPVADIERLISYLTTLCHIKRAVRSASETNLLSDNEE
jgi:hypothetical protein